MKGTFEYPINMTPETSKYWYDRFIEFSTQNSDKFEGLTFADYLGTQVLTSMMLIFKGQTSVEEVAAKEVIDES